MNKITELNRWIWIRINRTFFSIEPNIRSLRELYVLLFLLLFFPNFMWLSEIPTSFFLAPKMSFAAFFSTFPSYLSLIILHISILVSLLLIGFNKISKIAGLVACVLLVILYSFGYSLGKIDHNILFVMSLLCLSIVNWGKSKESNGVYGLSLLSIFLTFAISKTI